MNSLAEILRRKRTKQIGLVCVSALLSISLLELILAPMLLPGMKGRNRKVALTGVAADPGIVLDGVQINDDGFTGVTLANLDQGPDTVRILTLGGSVMFYLGMAEWIQSALDPMTDRKVQVVGGALPRHMTIHSLIKFRQLFTDYDFNYVIVYHRINDLWANHCKAGEFRQDYSHLDPWFKRNTLLNHSLIARSLYNQWIWRPLEDQFDLRNGADHAAARSFDANLRSLIDAITESGGTPIVMTFASNIPSEYDPTRFAQNALGYGEALGFRPTPVELWGDVDYVRNGLRLHNRVIRDFVDNVPTLLLDQEAVLSSNIKNFADPVHLSEAGGRRFVGSLRNFFQQLNLLDR
jgi:hypothetical protein